MSRAKELTKQIINQYNNGKKLECDTEDSINIFNSQVKYEEDFIANNRLCHNAKGENIDLSEISRYNNDTASKQLRERFWDYHFMEAIRCMINEIIDIKDGDGESERARIHKFLDGLTRFGKISSYSFALSGNISGRYSKSDSSNKYNGSMVVIKCPREPFNVKELVHELVIGIGALNKLRQYIPNFSYVYDAFYCSAPVVDDNNDVINWCMLSDNPVSYVIYENIQDACDLSDIESIINPHITTECLSYIMQISLAEYLAEGVCDFAHCDLHDQNVLLRRCNDGKLFYIRYLFEDKYYFIPAPGRIATIIDYGMSHAKLEDNTDIGKLDSSGYFSNIGIPHNNTRAIADIHKLLGFLIQGAIDNNNHYLVDCVGKLFTGYFYNDINISKERLREMITIQSTSLFHVPFNIVDQERWSLTSFIQYLDEYTKHSYNITLLNETIPNDSKVLYDDDMTIKDIEEIKIDLELNIPEIPSLFDLLQSRSPKLLENICKNIDDVIRNEKKELASIFSSYHTSFYVIPKKYEELIETLDYTNTSIEELSIILTNSWKLGQKITEIAKSLTIIDDKSGKLRKLLDNCTSKYEKLMSYVRRIFPQVIKNFEIIQRFIFGKILIAELTEEENNHYIEHPLLDLYKKYKLIMSGFDKIDIKKSSKEIVGINESC